MDTPANHDRGAICSVSEMAYKVGLGRARFYQLVKEGVFPPPTRCGNKRPAYPPDLQEKCLEIRRKRVGFNGLPVLFNRPRQSGRARSKPGGQYDGLVAALKNMGLEVNARDVKHAVQVLYPAGLEQIQDQGEMLRDLFQHFRRDCRRSV